MAWIWRTGCWGRSIDPFFVFLMNFLSVISVWVLGNKNNKILTHHKKIVGLFKFHISTNWTLKISTTEIIFCIAMRGSFVIKLGWHRCYNVHLKEDVEFPEGKKCSINFRIWRFRIYFQKLFWPGPSWWKKSRDFQRVENVDFDP